ncbi:MAG: hypothetical protein DRP29_00300 [Thermodesulfobacteriota bacterium]|nr:MAG: hypothetical protein DRP29_00300 [Thermodesulfobacteriota bacterium]
MSWDIFDLLRWVFNEHGGEVYSVVVLAVLAVMNMRLKDVKQRLNRLEERIDHLYEIISKHFKEE